MRLRAQQSCPALSNTDARRRRGRLLEVGVGEDDVRALAAELEGDGLDLRGAPGGDLLADLGRPGEHDLAHLLVGDEPLPDDRAAAGQHLEEVLRQPRLERELAEADRRQRRPVGGLQQHGVAGGERGREAPRRDRHREVPRHDDADHAERLVEGDVHAAGDRDLLPDHPLGRTGVVVQDVADVPGLPPRRTDRMSRVAHLELRELLDVRVDGRGELPQGTGAVGRGEGGPRPLRLDRVGDRLIHLLEGGVRHLLQHRLVGRVDEGGGCRRAHARTLRCGACAASIRPGEEPHVLGGVLLGMPLHGDAERDALQLERLDGAVAGAGRHAQARPDILYRLMVVALDVELAVAAEQLDELGVRIDLDLGWSRSCRRPCCSGRRRPRRAGAAAACRRG